MKISTKVQDALNKQINSEFFSAYLYLAASAYFESLNLKGFAAWMRRQAKEEEEHAMKFYEFIIARQGQVKLLAITEPKTPWKSPLQVFEQTYKHEQAVTGMIHDLVALARAEKDTATEFFLKWFVDEQVEEEDMANELVEKLKLIGDSRSGLYMMDKDMAERK